VTAPASASGPLELRPLREYPTVATWEAGLKQQWGEADPLGDDPDKLAALQAFCRFVGEDPDTVVGHCFRIRKSDGERVLSVKWRTHYADKVKEFRAQMPGMEGRRRSAAVLGFLIHNGVLIQA
jgi:hypothetical protein